MSRFTRILAGAALPAWAACLITAPASHAGPGIDTAIDVHGYFQAMLRADGRKGVLQNWSYMGNPFNNFQLFVNTDAIVSERVAIFTRVRFDDAASNAIGLDGAYMQFQNFVPADLYVQLGKVPSPFGAFQERSYPDRNPLIGLPLMYYYHTTLRYDVIPQGAADLWAVKGKNQSGFTYPSMTGGSSRTGMPIIYDPCWDYGVIVLGTWKTLEGRLAVMNGAPGYPETGREWNPSRTPVARLGWVPAPWLRLGGSAARGPYLPYPVESQLPAGKGLDDYTQTVFGCDAEVTRGWWELRGEWVRNEFVNPGVSDDLLCDSWYLEARRKMSAGTYASLRWDTFTYGEITGPDGLEGRWGQNVSRLEVGGGIWAEQNLLFKAGLQITRIGEGGFKPENRIGGVQAVMRF